MCRRVRWLSLARRWAWTLALAGLVVLPYARADLSRLTGEDPAAQDMGLLIPRGYQELDAAKSLLKEGKGEAAFEMLQRAVAGHPELPPARLLLSLLFFSAGNGAQGAALLEQAAAESPGHPEVYAALGKLALAERRLAFARLSFEKAASLKAPGEWTEARKRQFAATCHEGLAIVAESSQDWPTAQAQLAALLAVDSKNGRTHHRLARALFLLNRPEQALAELREGCKLDALLEPSAVAMGRLYAQARNAPKAQEWLEAAVKEDPRNPRVRLAIASWLLEQGRPEEAREQLKVAQSLQSATRELRRLQGLVARSLKNHAEAETIFQSLLQESPADTIASDQLALALIDQDDQAKWSRALQIAELNARAYPNDPTVLATYGWVLYRYGRLDEADRALRTAAARGPIGSDAAYFLARVLDARGSQKDARSLIESALQTPGTFVNRRAAREWLDAHPAKP